VQPGGEDEQQGGTVDILSCGKLTVKIMPVPPVTATTSNNVTSQNLSPLVGQVQLPAVTVVANPCLTFFLQSAPDSYLQSTAGTKMAVSGPNAVAISDGE